MSTESRDGIPSKVLKIDDMVIEPMAPYFSH